MRGPVALAAALVLAAAPAMPAQTPLRVGPQVSYGNNTDAGVGLRLEGPFSTLPDWRFAGSFDLFLPDGSLEYWEFNTNVLRLFPMSGVSPYVGTGMVLAHSRIEGVPNSDDTNLGLNLLGGMRFPTQSRLTPFFELRLQLSGGDQAVLATGVLF
jgi:hypothetical protein